MIFLELGKAHYQGCIFWPFPPPGGGGEIGTFWSLGKKIDPPRKKNWGKEKFQKIQILYKNIFSITTESLESNT